MKAPKNVTVWLDSLELNRFHVLVMFLAGFTLVFDGYDSQIIAYIMPQAIKEWNLKPVMAGSIASYGFAGLMCGAAIFGMIADRIGRKGGLMLAILFFSIFSGVAAFAPNFKTFCILRFLAGLGMGGAMPITIAIVSEFSPARIRAKSVTAMFAGFTTGWAVAGAVAMGVIPTLGWRAALFMGFIPLLFLPVMKWLCPESVRFLAGKGKLNEAIAQMRRVERAAGIYPIPWSEEHFSFGPGPQKKGKLSDIFSKGLIAMTILLWFGYFFNLLVTYGLSTWLPTLLVKQGFSVVKSYSYGLIQAIGASVGGFACGWMMDKFGRKAALFICYFLGGFAVLLFGTVTSTVSLYIYGGLAGMLIIGAQIGIQVVAGESYPTAIRTTGAGWVMTFGRIGAILAGVLGGVLVQAGFTFQQFFVFYSVPCFIVAGIALLFRVNKSDTLEHIHEKLVATRAKPAMAPARSDEAL